MITKICIWKGLKNSYFEDNLNKIISDLLKNSYDPNKGFKHKRTKSGIPLYTVKVNKQSRLLFTIKEHNNKRYLIVLDYIEDHKYENSTYFNNKSALKNFIAKQITDNIAEINLNDFVDNTDIKDKIIFSEQVTSNTQQISNHGEQLIFWTEEQEEALNLKLPLIINGPAGSGKTSMAMEFFLKLIDKPVKVIYIAQSQLLIYFFQNIWEQTIKENALNINPNFNINFVSYESFILTNSNASKTQIVSFNDFLKWYNTVPTSIMSLKTEKPDPEIIYNEFKILTQNGSYIGCRLTVLNNNDQQMQVMNIYNTYKKYLEDNKKIDLNLTVVTPKTAYDCVIADESQNLTQAQIETIKKAALEEQCLFLQDTNQTYENLIRRIDNKIPICQLSSTHRNTIPIAKLASNILKMKNFILTGVIQTTDYLEYVSTIQGPEVICFPNSQDIQALMQNNPNFAILTTNEEQKIIAEKTFKNIHQIYTSTQALGLEFDIVVLYGPFEKNRVIKEINNALKNICKFDIKDRKNLPKNKTISAETISLLKRLNEIFICITRAKKQLLIVQDIQHENEHIFNFLKTDIIHQNKITSQIMHPANNQNNQASWLEVAKKLILSNELELAKNILITELKFDAIRINEFINSLKPKQPKEEYTELSSLKIKQYLEKYPEHKGKTWIHIDNQNMHLDVLQLSFFITGFISRLLQNENVEKTVTNNLNNLFDKPSFIYAMFYHDVKNSNLLSWLLNNKNTRNITITWFYLKLNSEHQTKVADENISKLLYELSIYNDPDKRIKFFASYLGFSSNQDRCLKFWELYKKNPDFQSRFPDELAILCDPNKSLPKTILHNIALNADREFIAELKANEALLKSIKNNELIKEIFFFVHDTYSPFYYFLTNRAEGIEDTLFLHQNLNILKNINKNALHIIPSNNRNYLKNISTFCFITSQATFGIALLNALQEIKKTKKDIYSWKEICAIQSNVPTDYYYNISPLFYLCSNVLGVNYLINELQYISADDLKIISSSLTSSTGNAYPLSDTCPLKFLILLPNGVIFLQNLLNNNDFKTSFFKKINFDLLTKPINNNILSKLLDYRPVGHLNNFFYWLSLHEAGIKILLSLVQEKVILFDTSNIHYLIGKNEKFKERPIFFLAQEYLGLVLLNNLITTDAKLSDPIIATLELMLNTNSKIKMFLKKIGKDYNEAIKEILELLGYRRVSTTVSPNFYPGLFSANYSEKPKKDEVSQSQNYV